MKLLFDLEAGVAAKLRQAIPDLQILERESDEIRGPLVATVKASIDREYIYGSRIWETMVEVDIRVNRREYTGQADADIFQNVFSTLCNTTKEQMSSATTELLSWFVQSVNTQTSSDVSVSSIRVKTHAVQVS